MKNLKKIALMTLLGTGMFIPATRADDIALNNINAVISIFTVYKTYLNKLDSVKNRNALKAWIKAFTKDMNKAIKNISNTNRGKQIKLDMKKFENYIISVEKLSDSECVYVAQALKFELAKIFSNF